MKLKKFLYWISDLWYQKFSGGNRLKREYQERCLQVWSICNEILPNSPHVFNGNWNWSRDLETGLWIPISLVYIEEGIVILVDSLAIQPWLEARNYCKNKESWQLANSLRSKILTVLTNDNLNVIIVECNTRIEKELLEKRIAPFIRE